MKNCFLSFRHFRPLGPFFHRFDLPSLRYCCAMIAAESKWPPNRLNQPTNPLQYSKPFAVLCPVLPVAKPAFGPRLPPGIILAYKPPRSMIVILLPFCFISLIKEVAIGFRRAGECDSDSG